MSVYREVDGNIIREYKLDTTSSFRRQTEKALVEIIPTQEYGRCLFIDNELQLAEKDEYIYHESLIHPCLMTASSRKKICIFGGGDGCAAREVLKWPDIDHICILDWDSEVTRLFQETYSDINGRSLQDPRVTIENKNIQDLLHENRSYDCIIVDLLDPKDTQEALWKDIFHLINHWLHDKGQVVINAGGIMPWQTENVDWLQTLFQRSTQFHKIILYKTFVPSFGREWCFLLANTSTKEYSSTISTISCKYFDDNAWNRMKTWTKDYLNKLPEL